MEFYCTWSKICPCSTLSTTNSLPHTHIKTPVISGQDVKVNYDYSRYVQSTEFSLYRKHFLSLSNYFTERFHGTDALWNKADLYNNNWNKQVTVYRHGYKHYDFLVRVWWRQILYKSSRTVLCPTKISALPNCDLSTNYKKKSCRRMTNIKMLSALSLHMRNIFTIKKSFLYKYHLVCSASRHVHNRRCQSKLPRLLHDSMPTEQTNKTLK